MSTPTNGGAPVSKSAAATKRYRDTHLNQTRASSCSRSATIRERRYALLNAIKLESGCVDCGYRTDPVALQFDHIDPATKLFSVSQALTHSLQRLLAEVAKCEVRCANCHSIRSVRDNHKGNALHKIAGI